MKKLMLLGLLMFCFGCNAAAMQGFAQGYGATRGFYIPPYQSPVTYQPVGGAYTYGTFYTPKGVAFYNAVTYGQ